MTIGDHLDSPLHGGAVMTKESAASTVIYGDAGEGKRRTINKLPLDDRRWHLWREVIYGDKHFRLVMAGLAKGRVPAIPLNAARQCPGVTRTRRCAATGDDERGPASKVIYGAAGNEKG